MAITVEDFRDELADREAIRDCILRYARGIDRLDMELTKSTYWEDATDEHLDFKGNGHDFIDSVFPELKAMQQGVHMIGNMLIAVDGANANVETYVCAFHRYPSATGQMTDNATGVRWLHKMQRRDRIWKIADRLVIVDWFRGAPSSADWSMGYRGYHGKRESPMPVDRSYAHFAGGI